MPHKHKRSGTRDDASFYELPPSKSATSLPTGRAQHPQKQNSKSKNARAFDDTPRAFARLFTGHQPPRAGLDDGNTRLTKKRKKIPQSHEAAPPPTSEDQQPTSNVASDLHILPHESLPAFSARVNATLPFKSLPQQRAGPNASTTTPDPKYQGRGGQTKLERKMQRMQAAWRDEDRRMREKRARELSEDEDDDGYDVLEEDRDEGGDVDERTKKSKSNSKKIGKQGRKGKGNKEEGDIWAHVTGAATPTADPKPSGGSHHPALAPGGDGLDQERKRKGKGRGGGLVGLHDVVQAPPKLNLNPNLKPKSNPNLKSGLGLGLGLRRQGELLDARKRVVQGYRAMMKARREAGGEE